MKHKLWMPVAILAVAALFVGCGPTQTQTGTPGGDPQQTMQSTEEQSAPAENPFGSGKQPEKPEAAELTVATASGTQTVEAEIYKGMGYSITVPKTWVRDDNEPEWSPTKKSDAELTVRFYPNKKVDEVVELFRTSEDDYTFEEPAKATLGSNADVTMLKGAEMDDGELEELIAYFVKADSGCYGILLECPASEADLYGGYLNAMANTFTLVKAEK